LLRTIVVIFLFTALIAPYCIFKIVFSYSAIQPQLCLINSVTVSHVVLCRIFCDSMEAAGIGQRHWSLDGDWWRVST